MVEPSSRSPEFEAFLRDFDQYKKAHEEDLKDLTYGTIVSCRKETTELIDSYVVKAKANLAAILLELDPADMMQRSVVAEVDNWLSTVLSQGSDFDRVAASFWLGSRSSEETQTTWSSSLLKEKE